MANDQVTYAVQVFFGGFFTVFGLVLVVYLCSWIADRLPCMNVGTYILTPAEVEERRVASSLTKEAKLAGMLASEKTHVFRTFFETRSFPFKTGEDDVEAQLYSGEKAKSDEGLENTEPDTMESACDIGDDDAEPDRRQCAICLNEYEEGDKVMNGTLCEHIFHYECCMQWIEKNNEDCPYCRKPMMEPKELVDAARSALGELRVAKLIKVNEEAAERMAAFESARQAGLASSMADVPPPGGHSSTPSGVNESSVNIAPTEVPLAPASDSADLEVAGENDSEDAPPSTMTVEGDRGVSEGPSSPEAPKSQ